MSKLRSSLFACLFAAAIVPGCTKQHNPAACIQGHCSDPSLPFCDLDGAVAGEPNTCISVDCTPGEFDSCFSPNEALVCDTAGTSLDHNHCELGCDDATGCITSVTTCEPGTVMCGDRVVETCGADGHFSSQVCDVSCIDGPAPHCSYLSPKYLPDVCDSLATADHLDLGPFNTDIDSQCNGGIVAQTDGPSICVVRYSTITVPAGIEAKITGHRALALVADASLDILGALDVSADGLVPGPAAGSYARSFSAGVNVLTQPPMSPVGGGGAGFGNRGAAGGSSNGPGTASNGGAQSPYPLSALAGADWMPATLASGSPGGRAYSQGGGNGGAATLISCRGTVKIAGTVDAGGGGGAHGYSDGTTTLITVSGGAGGGAGGLISLQGLRVVATGSVYANGGGGATSSGSSGTFDGRDGMRSMSASLGVEASGAGSGGAGQTIANPPGQGGGSSSTYAGGGGGGVGILELVVPQGITPAAPGAASPAFLPPLQAAVR